MTLGLAAVILVGLSASTPNPGTYIQVNFAAGPTGGAPVGQKALIIGNKTAAGTAVVETTVYGPDTPVTVQTESDVITQFGAGSQMHRAWVRFNAVNKTTPVYFICAAESAGAQATGVVVVTGTATSAGNVRFWYEDVFVDTAVNVGDTPTIIAGNIVANINNQFRWGITAANTAGVVTLTARNHGPEGNWIKVQVQAGPGFAPGGVTVTDYGSTWAATTAFATGTFAQPSVANGYYYEASTGGTTSSSPPTWPTTIGTTVTDGSVTWTCWGTLSSIGIASLGGGATADNYTNALATVASQGFYNIISCDSDATNLGRINTQVNTQALPITGIRQRFFAGSVDTIANATTIATGLNNPRAEIIWGSCTDITPLELAANNAAIYSLFEQTGNTGYRYVGRLNFSLFPTANPLYNDAAYWLILGTRNGPSAGPSFVQVTSALNNGLTPIQLLLSGAAQLVKRCTTHSILTGGSTNDYRIRDAHKVAIMDAWAAAVVSVVQQQFGGKDLLDPPPPGQSPAAFQTPNVFATNVTYIGNAMKDLTSKMGVAGLLQYTDNTNANAIIQREQNPRTRVSASFDLVTADILDQTAIVANQVG